MTPQHVIQTPIVTYNRPYNLNMFATYKTGDWETGTPDGHGRHVPRPAGTDLKRLDCVFISTVSRGTPNLSAADHPWVSDMHEVVSIAFGDMDKDPLKRDGISGARRVSESQSLRRVKPKSSNQWPRTRQSSHTDTEARGLRCSSSAVNYISTSSLAHISIAKKSLQGNEWSRWRLYPTYWPSTKAELSFMGRGEEENRLRKSP